MLPVRAFGCEGVRLAKVAGFDAKLDAFWCITPGVH